MAIKWRLAFVVTCGMAMGRPLSRPRSNKRNVQGNSRRFLSMR